MTSASTALTIATITMIEYISTVRIPSESPTVATTISIAPRAFMPERFLPGNREKLHRFQYLPFGAGPRTCIGATFALQEAVIALAVLMKRYRFDMTADTNPWPIQRLTTQPRGGLPLRVTVR